MAGNHSAIIARLGLGADDMRSRTAAELDGAVRRLRLLVGGFLALAA